MDKRYRIRCDGMLIGDLNDPDLVYYDGILKEAVNSAGTLTFTLPSKNEYHDIIYPLKSVIDLYRGTELVWRGRVLSITPDIYGNAKYLCEGALAFLNDECPVEQTDDIYRAADVEFRTIIEWHNSSCDPWKTLVIGEISPEFTKRQVQLVRDTSNRDTYLPLFERMKRLIEDAGGSVTVTFDSEQNTVINYIISKKHASQPLVFRKNIVDITRQFDTSSIATSVLAIAKNNYTVFVENEAAAAVFGHITRRITANIEASYTNRVELETIAKQALDMYSLGTSQIKVKAVDLSELDDNFDRFEVGTLVRIISKEHGINTEVELTEKQTNICNLSQSYITLGKTTSSLTKFVTR